MDLLQADAAADLRGAAHRRLRGVETAARGGAADHRADDRRVRADARRFGARSGRARHQADGEAAVGDPRRGVHLLHLEPGHVAGHRALLRGPGRREEHRPAEPEAVRQFRPDPAGRFAAAGEAALHRRRADPGAHALQPPLRRFRTAAHRRAARRHHQTGAGRLRRHPDRRPAARSAHRAGPGQTGGLQMSPLAGGRARSGFRIAACPRASSIRGTANTSWKPASFCAPPRTFATWWWAWRTTSRCSCATWRK